MKKQILLISGILVVFLFGSTSCFKNYIGYGATDVPWIETLKVSDQTLTTVDCGGVIQSTGGGKISDKGVCWSTNPNPDLEDNSISAGKGDNNFDVLIEGLVTGEIYYFRAYATNSYGTGYGQEIEYMAGVGVYDKGGAIVYILQDGDPGYDPNTLHGLVVTKKDQADYTTWGESELVGNTSMAIGTGQDNTNKILSKNNDPNIAAKICDDLVEEGQSDWYLPSLEEIRKFVEISSELSYSQSMYWTSSEEDKMDAFAVDPENGGYEYRYKLATATTRCFRTF
jgi:hypothetical protein